MSVPMTPFTPQEKRLSIYLKALAVFYSVATLAYLIPGIISLPASFAPYRFLTDPAYDNNSTVKIALFALLTWIAAANVRKYREMIVVVIVASIVAEIASITLVLFAKNNYLISTNPVMYVTDILVGSIIFDGLIAGVLLGFFLSAERSRLNLLYFSPMQFRALKAVAEVAIDGEGATVISAEQIARNVDEYLSNFEAKSKWITKVVFTMMQIFPLFSFNPPLSYMSREKRLAYLKKRFYQDVTLRIMPEFIRVFIQAMIRMSKQLCYMGYYNDTRVFDAIGYKPFSRRSDYDERINLYPEVPRKNLIVMDEGSIPGDEFSAEIAIVGSGAAASILAHGLVERGHHVLLIERGKHHDRSEFTENEIEMVSKLYADGALQMASDFRFQVFQGSCVGGSTVVNNAVCFDLPPEVLDRWVDPRGLNAGLSTPDVIASMDFVKKLIHVNAVPLLALDKHLNPGGRKFIQGIHALGLHSTPNTYGSVVANIEHCIGCGYCNIGCQFGRKLSMLDTVLPTVQASGKGKLEIIASCEVLKFEGTGENVTAALGEFTSGRRIKIKADKFILSAGAISSSIVLLRSGISKNAGKRLGFNVGSQITAAFAERIDSYDGLQISHYLKPSPSRGYVIETWYNPPMFQSTAMPGWFEDHYRNMLRYNKLACGGVLTGSESNAEVRIAGLTGREIRYTPTQRDFTNLLEGLKLAGNIFLAAGAESVMPNSFKYYEFDSSLALSGLNDVLKDTSDLSIGTGHPQGGNVMSKDANVGVVGPDFKVHGYKNLYVCDASVFPSTLGVNPQITVMTLANYAASSIAQEA